MELNVIYFEDARRMKEVKRLIKIYFFAEDTVLEPFMVSGTTAKKEDDAGL
jgi:hypothetical protein